MRTPMPTTTRMSDLWRTNEPKVLCIRQNPVVARPLLEFTLSGIANLLESEA
jgi:hypothetical protein